MDASMDELLKRRVARFVDRRADWDAFADARVEGFRRAQHRFIGAGASGKKDPNAIPAEHFTLSIMFVPPGQGNREPAGVDTDARRLDQDGSQNAAAEPEAQVARDTVTASLEDGVRHPAGEQPDDDHRDHLGAHVRTPNAGFFSVVATVIDSASQSRRTSSYLQTAPDRVRP